MSAPYPEAKKLMDVFLGVGRGKEGAFAFREFVNLLLRATLMPKSEFARLHTGEEPGVYILGDERTDSR